MSQSNLKNMVVLKNLPSNIVEEAIVIFKENKKVKNLEKVDKNKVIDNNTERVKSKEYILKEAEMLVSNYISRLEEKQNNKKINNQKVNKKYKKIKNYAYIISIIVLIETIIIFIR